MPLFTPDDTSNSKIWYAKPKVFPCDVPKIEVDKTKLSSLLSAVLRYPVGIQCRRYSETAADLTTRNSS